MEADALRDSPLALISTTSPGFRLASKANFVEFGLYSSSGVMFLATIGVPELMLTVTDPPFTADIFALELVDRCTMCNKASPCNCKDRSDRLTRSLFHQVRN